MGVLEADTPCDDVARGGNAAGDVGDAIGHFGAHIDAADAQRNAGATRSAPEFPARCVLGPALKRMAPVKGAILH
jgi:hypothetical protein